MTGKIIKSLAGFYEVASGNQIYTCRAKGIFRKLNKKPLVGDNVCFHMEYDDGSIDSILERKNVLIRPAVANIDLVLIVLALKQPEPNLFLLDRYLLNAQKSNITAAIVWNKLDLDSSSEHDEYAAIYKKAGYDSFYISSKSGEGMDDVLKFLKGKSTVLAGPSGVGKSTITNSLCPLASMETGELSKKIERGKQTTRHTEFFVITQGSYLCDTPGFTSVYITGLDKYTLKDYFPEFEYFEPHCRFNECLHMAEPDCAVKDAVEKGLLAKSRYDSYIKILTEIREGNRI